MINRSCLIKNECPQSRFSFSTFSLLNNRHENFAQRYKARSEITCQVRCKPPFLFIKEESTLSHTTDKMMPYKRFLFLLELPVCQGEEVLI